MKKKKAVSIIQKQIFKLEKEENHNSVWLIETRTYIDSFFGNKSRQSEKMNILNFNIQALFKENEEQNLKDIKTFLNSCIETINNLGLYKNPRKIFLSTISDRLLIFILGGLVSVSMYVGKYFSDTQNIAYKQDIKILNKTIDSLKKEIVLPSVFPEKKTDVSINKKEEPSN